MIEAQAGDADGGHRGRLRHAILHDQQRDGQGKDDEQADQLDPVIHGHGRLLAESGIQELQPDLPQLLLVGRAEGLAQLVRRRRDLRLEQLLPLRQARLRGVPAGIRVEEPPEPILGIPRPAREQPEGNPGPQRDGHEHRRRDHDVVGGHHVGSHLDRDDLLD